MADHSSPLISIPGASTPSPTETSTSSTSPTSSSDTSISSSTSTTSSSNAPPQSPTSSTTSTDSGSSTSISASPTSTSNTDTTSTSSSDTTTSSSTSSTITSSSTSSSTISTHSQTPSQTPTGTSQTVISTTNINGQQTTLTSIVVVTPSPSETAASTSVQKSSKGFFRNTGAVAGVFSVVGVLVLVLIFAIVTNAIRRRRAQKLDREIAEAAAEAANAPAFADDDFYPDDRYKGGPPSSGGGDMRSMTTGYSDTTHGTFAQAPMNHESYNMAELPSSYDYGAGAAGVGAMGLNRARSQTQPFNAFAAPPQPNMSNPYDAYQQRPPGPEMGILDAAGLSGGAPARYEEYGQNGTNIARSLGPSQVTSTPGSQYNSYSPPQDYNQYIPSNAGYDHFHDAPPQGYGQYGGSVPPPRQQSPIAELSQRNSVVDPYSGYVDPAPPVPIQAPSPPPERLLGGNFASPPPSSDSHDDIRLSYQDEDDYGHQPRRVLKVANE